MSVSLISQGPTLNDDLSASSSSSVEISGLLSEAKMSGRAHTLVLSSDEVMQVHCVPRRLQFICSRCAVSNQHEIYFAEPNLKCEPLIQAYKVNIFKTYLFFCLFASASIYYSVYKRKSTVPAGCSISHMSKNKCSSLKCLLFSMLQNQESGYDRWWGETEAVSLQRMCVLLRVFVCLVVHKPFVCVSLSRFISREGCVSSACLTEWICLNILNVGVTELILLISFETHYSFSVRWRFMVEPLVRLSQLSPCLFSCCSDPRWGALIKAVSVAEPQHYWVDFPASGPLAHGPQLRTPYPRIHCQKHRWRTAVTAG